MWPFHLFIIQSWVKLFFYLKDFSINYIKMKTITIFGYTVYTHRNTHTLPCTCAWAFVHLITCSVAYVHVFVCICYWICVCMPIESSMQPGKRGMVLFGLGIKLSCQNSRRTSEAEMKAERVEQPSWFCCCCAVSRQTEIDQIGVGICSRYYWGAFVKEAELNQSKHC